MKFKRLQNNNIENNNHISQQNKKEANLLKNSPFSKEEENKKEEIFFVECLLCFFNPKVGEKIGVTRNVPSKGLKTGSIGTIEKNYIYN